MYKWCFVAFLIVCVEAWDDKIYTFDEEKIILAKCIEQQLVSFDGTFKSSQVAKKMVDFAAKRFYGKSMSGYTFNNRFYELHYEIRNGKIRNDIKNELSEKLRVALRHALTICSNFTIEKTKESKKVMAPSDVFISFGADKSFLSNCIENHIKLSGRQDIILNLEYTEFISATVASRYFGRSFSKNHFNQKNTDLYRYFREKNILVDSTTGRLSRGLTSTIKQALVDCAVGKNPFIAVPTFELEPKQVALLLNLILVKWPDSLYHMIQSKNGRAVLRRYGNDALAALISVLNDFQNNTQIFRSTLRSYWYNRALIMYDDSSADFPYIVHHYTKNYPTPHMIQSDFKKFINRNSIDFNQRNPLVSESYLREILNIHRSDSPNVNEHADIFDDYNKNCMTSAEYYFENQLNQFYRIIFFLLELQAGLIYTDEDDVFEGALPDDLVPEYVQAMVYDDDFYRNYLFNQRSFYKKLMDNSRAQNLFESDWVLEEDLVLLMSNTPSTSGVQSRSESFTTESTIHTTTQSFKRKDDVWRNKNGKCFPKRAKTMTENLDIDEVTISALQENLNHFVIDLTDEVPSSTFEENSKHFVIDLTDDDSHNEFVASLNQGKNETNNVYGYVTGDDDDDSMLFQFSTEDLIFSQVMRSFSNS